MCSLYNSTFSDRFLCEILHTDTVNLGKNCRQHTYSNKQPLMYIQPLLCDLYALLFLKVVISNVIHCA